MPGILPCLTADQYNDDREVAEGLWVHQREKITDEDRKAYFGLIPAEWTRYEAGRIEESIWSRRDSR